MVAVLGDGAPRMTGPLVLMPSVTGAGTDFILATDGQMASRASGTGLVEVGPNDLETWRIRRGVARMMVDFGADALPAEAGLEDAIDFTKGCFLGQESVAKVRNLGHPPRVLLLLRSGRADVRGCTGLLKDGVIVGEVTSVAAASRASMRSSASGGMRRANPSRRRPDHSSYSTRSR